MPGCFLDEIGHRRFRVQEGHVTSGLTSEKLGGGGGGVALRRAYGPSDTHLNPLPFFFFFPHDDE